MHILYLPGNMNLPNEAGPRRAWQQAAYWAKRGHKVTVLCSNQKNMGFNLKGASVSVSNTSKIEDGLIIHYFGTPSKKRQSLLHRLWYYISVNFRTFSTGLKQQKVDLIYVRSLPPGLPLIGWLLSRWYQVPMVQNIVDLQPESAVAAGLVKSRIILSAWDTIENLGRRASVLLDVFAPEFRDNLVAKGFSPDRIQITPHAWLPNSHSLDPLPKEIEELLQSWEGGFWVTYAGTMNHIIALDVCLEAAQFLQGKTPLIIFIFIGEGATKKKLIGRCREKQLTNCLFLDPIPRNCLRTLLNKAAITISSFTKSYTETVGAHLNNKFFDSLEAGKPIIHAGGGEIARHIRIARCGLVIPPEDPQAMAAAITYLYQHPQEAAAMGQRGLSYLKENFAEERVFGALVDRLEQIYRFPMQKESCTRE